MDVVGGKKDASIDDSFDLITPKITMKANAVNKALAFMFFLDICFFRGAEEEEVAPVCIEGSHIYSGCGDSSGISG